MKKQGMKTAGIVLAAALLALSGPAARGGDGERNRPDEAAPQKKKLDRKNPRAKTVTRETEKPHHNPLVRFWIHTVGAPMARGLKDGTRKVYKGLKTGARKISHAFNGGSREADKTNEAKGKEKPGERK